MPYGIRSSLFLNQDLINKNFTINVPFAGKILTRDVAPILVSGPYLTCPRSMRLVRRDNKVEIGCEIRTEPLIPANNITWSVKGEKSLEQNGGQMEKTAYGQNIVMLFDLTKQVERNDEEIKISVQVYDTVEQIYMAMFWALS